MKQFLWCVSVILLFSSCSSSNKIVPETGQKAKAKNVILLIGDGMGLTQISAGTYAFYNTSSFERFLSIGLQKPHAGNALITDSAAGATAFACGQKTFNGAIAVDQDTMPIYTILEEAEERGLSTGLIATSSIVHATPASFIAHNRSRLNYEEIATDFLNTEIDLFIGGGKNYFDNRNSDDRNLYQELEAKGYEVQNFLTTELKNVNPSSTKNFAFFTANAEPLPRSQGREYLGDAVKIALNHLNKHGEDGFFLMIEGAQIDWGGHARDLSYVLSEWEEFNLVIGQVLTWAKRNRETLVIVTSDHETGGLAIQQESKMNEIVGAFTSNYHTGTMVPVFAQGPGEERFRGIYDNTQIYVKMRAALGWPEK